MTAQKDFDFVVRTWSAWAPGIKNQADWQGWLNAYSNVSPEKAAIPGIVPKLLQRRLSPLARAVFNAADNCVDSNKPLPVVFSSAHGEVNKSLEMLRCMQRGEEISPTAFTLTVHNAISGLFSIAYSNHQEITVLALGQDGIAPAFIEALGLLQEHHDARDRAPKVGALSDAGAVAEEVLIVLYDEPLSDFYPSLPFALDAPTSCVLALKISLAGDGLPLQLCRSSEHRNDDGEHALQIFSFLKFLVTDEQSLQLGNHRHSWVWQKK